MKNFNPTGRIPVLKDGDFVLFESNAILQYICEKYGFDDLYPKNPQQRALVSQWLHWHHTASREFTVAYFAPTVRKDLAKVFTPEFLAPKRAAIKGALKVLEAQLQKTRFLVGSAPTIADLCVFQDIGQFSPHGLGLGGFDFTPYPAVDKWMARMEQLPGYKESHELLVSMKPLFEKAVDASKTQSKM